MNKKYQRLFLPRVHFYILVPVLFAAVTAFVDWKLAAAEAGVALLLVIHALISAGRRRRKMREFIASVTYNTESATNNTFLNFPLPMAVFDLDDGLVVWGNHPFWALCGVEEPLADGRMEELLPAFGTRWLTDGLEQMPELMEIGGRCYRVCGSLVHTGGRVRARELQGIIYWVDVTDYEELHREYLDSRPAEMVIIVDNFDELVKTLTDRQRIELRVRIDAVVEKWGEGLGGIMRRYDRDRYMFILEKRHLADIIRERFSLIDEIHSVTVPRGVHATVSIGVGVDGEGYEENFSFASLAAEMALSRGGDQAVIKNKFNFEFFGGRGAEVEKRTKVKSRVMANSLSQLIQDASRVFVMGHRYADLDTVGAAVGICAISRKLGKNCRIVLSDGPNASESLIRKLKIMLSYRDAFITPEDAILASDRGTLLVVVDTHRPEQVEDLSLLESCTRVAVIDHHRRAATYISNPVMSFYEPYASSACELVAELMQELLEPGDVQDGEADAVLSGIVLDTKSFTLRAGERTFDAAAFLRRCGADTTRVKLLLQNGIEETLARYEILRVAKFYKGVAVAAAQDTQSRVVASQAADELLNIHGVTASVVLYPTARGGVDVSARSIGDVNVQVLLERLGGGGNQSAAGAQMKDISLRDAVNLLFAAIDEYMATD